jgi:hypothetical protein
MAIYESCRYEFTDDELRALGDELARETRDRISSRIRRR